MITLLLLGCLHRPPVDLVPADEVVQQFGISAFGHSMAGLGVMALQEQHMELQALTPAGTLLFTVRFDDEVMRVQAPDPDMARMLERLPFYRDMALVYLWRCPEGRCDAGRGRVWESWEDEVLVRHYRGEDGPAEVRISEGRAVLEDPRRGYTVTLVGEQIHVP